MQAYLLSALVASSLLATSLSGCGGGGGSDSDSSFSGAASVSLDLSPSSIDTGDRTLVQLWVGDVHDNGVAIKLRYPSGLSYVTGTAKVVVDEDEVSIKPTVNVRTADRSTTYLVFFVPQKLFRESDEPYQGQARLIQLQLVGKTLVQEGLVEVDVDVNDARVADTEEFTVAKPEFVAADQQSITVLVGN